ncbi:MAG: type II secretion system inner membrane protein GspF [Burkholderiales bacterium]|jgi:general secretion pathway protein F|nr:type II secretion system inner membrane protein GspF [Burkholderiales bacterium]
MPRFQWEAVDAQGRITRGVRESENARALRQALQSEGLTPVAVDEALDAAATLSWTRLSPSLVSLLTRQLATLVYSGLPLHQALQAVTDQTDDKRARAIVTALAQHVAGGESFSAALAHYPRTFSPLYRGLVAAGVESGLLPEVLQRLADYLDGRLALKQKFITALIYPALLTIVALAVITAMLTYVVPQVVAVYEHSRQTLPWLTQALIYTSAFLRATGIYWLIGIGIVFIVAGLAYRRPQIRERVHRFWLKIPGLGRLLQSLETARFASTLAILVGSGAPLLRGLETAAGVLNLLPIRQAAQNAVGHVREGVALARALKESGVFPPILIHLVANGETTGKLSKMLERAAGELEREAERRLAWITALVQPVLIVLMGGIVLVLVLAIMMPIVSMNQLIR